MGRKRKLKEADMLILPEEADFFKEVKEDRKLILCNDVDEYFREYQHKVNLYLMTIEKRVTIESHDVFNEIVYLRDDVKEWRSKTVDAIGNLYSEIKGGSK